MLTLAVPTVIALTGCGSKKTEEKPPPVKIDAARTPQLLRVLRIITDLF